MAAEPFSQMSAAMSAADLRGTIDLHFHAGPDIRERRLTYLEAARQAEAAEMRAILIKSHATITADIAALIQPLVPKVRVFGAVALNAAVGGLNPNAVQTALALGAKAVWMPTVSAANHCRCVGRCGGIRVLGRNGRLKKPVMEIIEILAETGAILATGHLSAEESTTLAREALKRRVAKVVVTHPEHYYTQMPVTLQQKLARQGVFFDRCYPSARTSSVTMEEMAQRIRLVGVESTVLTTDFGQPESPLPVEGLRFYLSRLAEFGFSASELDRMARINPARLLGLQGSDSKP
jgi:hypothetical protein